MRLAQVNRYRVESRPSGAFIAGHEAWVFSNGTAAVSQHDLDSGRRLNRVALPGGANPLMRSSPIGGTLLQGYEGRAFAWTISAQSTVFLVSRSGALAKLQLGPYALRHWSFSAGAGGLALTHFGERAVHFIAADLSGEIRQPVPFEPGMVVFSNSGDRVYVADSVGDEIWVFDPKTGRNTQVIALSSYGRNQFPKVTETPDPPTAPFSRSPDGSHLFIGPLRTDEAEARSPLLTIDLSTRAVNLIVGEGIRLPYRITPNPMRPEIYVAGFDVTVAVNLPFRSVDRVIGRGRLTGMAVSPDGRWAASVSVTHESVELVDLEFDHSVDIPLGNLNDEAEFTEVPIEISPASKVAMVADTAGDQIVVIRAG